MTRIVVAEDNRLEMRNIEYILNSMQNCQLVGKFSNGEDTLAYLKENEADILITDIQMAKMTGIELIKELCRLNLDMEKIIISGYTDFNNAKEAIGIGVNNYVLKPFLDDEFEQVVNDVIKKRQKRKEKSYLYEDMKKHFENLKPILKEHFFRNLLLNADIDEENIKENEKLLGVSLIDKSKTVITCKIVHNKRELSNFFVCGAIVDFISQKKINKLKFFPILIDEKEIAVIIVGDAEGNNELVSNIIQLKNEVVKEYDIDMLIGVSYTECDIKKIYLQSQQSSSALQSVLLTHKNVVITYDEIGDDKAEQEFYISRLQYELKSVILEGDKEKVDSLINKYLKDDNNILWTRNFVYCYINILEIVMNEYGNSFETLFDSKLVWEKLISFESISNINMWIKNITNSVIDIVNSISHTDYEIVKKIKFIIENRYCEHITASTLAKEVNFSKKQIFRIFVKVTGMSLLDYITMFRMETSKKLILEGEKIYIVAEKVGYHDNVYFRKLFREYTGFTPQEFKKNILKTSVKTIYDI